LPVSTYQNGPLLNRRKSKIARNSSKTSPKSFTQQEVKLENSIFFPPGFEKPLLAIYFIFLPYLAGLLFIFFNIAKGKLAIYLSFNHDYSFILTWAVGYEILGTMILLLILKSAITFNREADTEGRVRFQRP
jgi:hypothetical protein